MKNIFLHAMYLLIVFPLVCFIANSFGKEKETFALGKSKFAAIVKSPVFVDKSLMIKQFFSNNFILITAPRRFGKSTNMDMIRRFCEIVVDQNGTSVLKSENKNYRIFTNKYEKINSFEYLDIYKDNAFFKKHFGQYPVIYVDFKLLSGKSWEDFKRSLIDMVRIMYSSYEYLLITNCLNEKEKRIFNRYSLSDPSVRLNSALFECDMVISLKLLSQYLYLYFNRRVIVFIDDYDAPIQQSIFNDGKDTDKIISFITKFTSTSLKSNQYVEKALLNACISSSGFFIIGANNIVRFLFTEKHPYNEYYGFTETEVKGLTKKFNVNSNLEKIRAWYNGYRVPNSKLKLYNIYSIVKFLGLKKFRYYWVELGPIKNLQNIFLNEIIGRKIRNLIKYRTIEIKTPYKVTDTEIGMLSKVINKKKYSMLGTTETDILLHFLLDLGYLTATNNKRDRLGNRMTIRIPNKEIRQELFKKMFSIEYYKRKFHLTDREVHKYVYSICKLGENINSYKELGKNVLNLFNRVDMPEQEEEIQEAMAAFPHFYSREFRKINSQVKIKVNDTTELRKIRKLVPGYDHIDIVIIRKDYTGIILEVKYISTGSKSNFSLYTGLEKIINKEYFKIFDLVSYKIQNKIYIGVTITQKDSETGKPQCLVTALYNSKDLKDNKTCIIV